MFFGRFEIKHFNPITEEVTRALRSEYNEFITWTMVPQDQLKNSFGDIKNPENFNVENKFYANALAFDLPLPRKNNQKKTDYLKKAKSDIKEKIKQHRDRIINEENVCFLLEDIPSEDFMHLKKAVASGLYSQYNSLSVIFVEKKRESKSINYDIFPLKITNDINKLVDKIVS